MANLLAITKETNDYFTFVLNGDSANAIKNTRNDLLTQGNICHFKTSEGANLIKEQNIIYGNITIIDGVTSLVPTSVDDLFTKLISVNFFDWINGIGGVGVTRFDNLDDTFNYFGKDQQVLRVNESELKLETFVMPDVSYLDYFPSPLVALKALRVKADNTGYEFYDPVNIVTQFIRSGYTQTSPSEDVVYQALQNLASFPIPVEYTAVGGEVDFDIGTTILARLMFWNGVPQAKAMWAQTGTLITLNFTNPLTSGDFIQMI